MESQERSNQRLGVLAGAGALLAAASVAWGEMTGPAVARPDWFVGLLGLGVLLLAGGCVGVMLHGGRRRREFEAVREAEWFARSTVDALSAQIAILDSAGTILAVNRAWRDQQTDQQSYAAGAEIGANYLEICDDLCRKGSIEAGQIARAVRAVGTGQQGEASAEYEASRRWYLCRITRFPGNAKTRIVIAHEDITARKQAERAADDAKRAADAANKAKSAFLANMSHEIRTPMTAILGYAELLRDPNQSAEERNNCIQVIRRNGDHLLSLINDVLDISKIEADKYSVECVSADLRQLLADVVALTRVRAIQKGLNFKVTVDGLVPKEIRTDPLRLKQILVNLVGNAIKFTREGSVHIRVSCQDRVVGSTLHIDVVDTGIGMSPEQLARLFRPFSQADESTTRKFGGTGLGLVISRRFAVLLGGDIAVQSAPGVGTCFSVWVDTGPLGGVRMLPSLTEADLASASPATRSESRHFRGRVLLAEDGEDNQQLISLLLKAVGLEVELAANGRRAVELASGGSFDLILMDMLMPELDGYGATRALREMGYKRPVVALTANAMSDDRAKCIAAGCDEYLTKPIVHEQLLSVLGRFLESVQAPVGGEPATAATPPGTSLRSKLADNGKFQAVLAKFISRLPERVEEIQRLLNENDLSQLARAVHQMKGAAGGYGYPEITAAAAQAEQSIKSAADLAAIRSQVEELTQLIRRIEGFPAIAEPPTGAAPVQPPPPQAAPLAEAAVPSRRVDPATGLPGRAHLLDRLSAELAYARRRQSELACIALQLVSDGDLKQECGPAVVDQLAERVAAALRGRCDGDLYVARSGELQFVVVAPGQSAPQAKQLACQFETQIRAMSLESLVSLRAVTCQSGVAALSLSTTSGEALLEAAVRECGTQPEPLAQPVSAHAP